MKTWLCSLLIASGALVHLAQAEPVVWEQTLADQGLKAPARITGYARRTDFFFALPVREPDLKASMAKLVVRTSPELSNRSGLRFFLQEQPISEIRVEPGRTIEVPLPLTSLARLWEPSDFLKVTVQSDLRDESDRSRCQIWDAEHLWIEIEPESSFRTVFDSSHPDWLSVARLPVTLRPGVMFPQAQDRVQLNSLLKLASWVTFLRPWDPGSTGGPDSIEWLPPQEDATAVQVQADGPRRTIRVSNKDASWPTLRALGRPVELRVPGTGLGVVGPNKPEWTPLEEVNLGALNSTFIKEQSGINLMVQTLGFDRALFGRDATDLELDLALRHTPVSRDGAGYVALYLNGRLLEAKPLRREAGTVTMQVPLRPPALSEDNALGLAVVYIPTSEECSNPSFFFRYQVDSASRIRVAGRSAPEKIAAVTTVAQRDFGRSIYGVVLPEEPRTAVEQAALHWVRWLQRTNSSGLLEPVLSNSQAIGGTRPTLVIDPSGDIARQGRWIERSVLRPGATGWVLTGSNQTDYSLTNVEPFGFLQALPSEPGRGTILWASALAPNGDELLAELARRMAHQPWAGPGNVLLSDGAGPVDAIDTANLDPASRLLGPEQVSEGWSVWRWLVLIPIWAVITWLALWIARPRR
ncbi:MAG: hypothetical protein OHK005_17880 [Candidatus Methylacidiphilales bacterium]